MCSIPRGGGIGLCLFAFKLILVSLCWTSNNIILTFLLCENILAGPDSPKGLPEAQDLSLPQFCNSGFSMCKINTYQQVLELV